MLKKMSFVLCCVLAVLLVYSYGAYALVVEHKSEADYYNDTSALTQLFTAESRIGNRSLSTVQSEILLGNSQVKEFPWINGQSVDFELSYNKVTDMITYKVGPGGNPSTTVNCSHSFSMLLSNLTDLYILVQVEPKPFYDANVFVYDLAFNGSPLGGSSNLYASDPAAPLFVDVLRISQASLNNGFTLKGKQRFSWTGTAPQSNNLYINISGYGYNSLNPVPEPASLMLLGLSLLGFLKIKRNN